MKKAKRILLLALSISLVAGFTLVPESAYAAAKITQKSGAAAPSSIYTGKSYTLKVAGTKVKFYSSNKKVATIGLTTGKMKVIAPGKVKITAKNAKTGKTTATKDFTVLQRAKSISLPEKEIVMGVGEEVKLTPTLEPATSTDVIRYTSFDKTIATVGTSSGKVKAVAPGITEIKVYAKATKATANSNKSNKVTTVKVKVYETPIKSLEQTGTDELTVDFGDEVTKVPMTSDFDLVDENNEPIPIAAVNPAPEQGENIYIIKVNVTLKPLGQYNLTYGDCSNEFTAPEPEVGGLDIEAPAVLRVRRSAEIKLTTKDKEGNKLYTYNYGDVILEPIIFTSEVTGGEIVDGKLTFTSSNGVAKLKAVYTPKDPAAEAITVEKTVYAYKPSSGQTSDTENISGNLK